MAVIPEIWQQRDLIVTFSRRELKSRYKQSLIGWVWSLLNPAATLGIYTLVFSTIFRGEPPVAGNGELRSYTIYLFIGLVCWNFFAGVINSSMGALLGAGSLLKKIYFPPFVPVIGNGVSALVQTGIELAILFVLLLVFGNLAPVALLAPVLLLMLAVFALGIGLVISLANVRFRDVGYLTGVVLQLLFYATPIIYPPELIPEETSGGFPIRDVLALNPMSEFVGAMRDVLWFQQVPATGDLALLAAMTLGSFLLGWMIFQRNSRDIAEEL